MTRPTQQLTTPKRPPGKTPRILRDLSLEQIVQIWRLSHGGISDPTDVKRITGVKARVNSIRAAVGVMDRAMLESLPLAEPVRCVRCGGLLQSIPCILCGPGRDAYRQWKPNAPL